MVDKYRLDKVIGEGSFAVVFSASTLLKDPRTHQRETVAVKCLYKTGLSRSQLALQREEINILKRVSAHPYITTLIDTCETIHHLYMVVELCQVDLFDTIMKGVFDPPKALRLFSQLTAAVSSCHEVGIYHRDLKPENVLLTSLDDDAQVRLTDFGLATTDFYSTEFGCGSVRYMAPECLGKKKTDKSPYLSAANDVWSLAIILINMLTGKNPWVEPSSKDKHFRSHILSTHARPVDTFRSQFNFSDGFCQVLRLVFCSTPENRPSARAFLDHVLRLPSLFHVAEGSLSPVFVPKGGKFPNSGLLSPSSLSGLANFVPALSLSAPAINLVLPATVPEFLPPTPESGWQFPISASFKHPAAVANIAKSPFAENEGMIFTMEDDS
ncbi:hypothetical protein HDV03_000044 [Kappamyces sp. JEL0829]|nr:hypothetical protein HDV03_000044 [Kappamyces sp. JEL0829]